MFGKFSGTLQLQSPSLGGDRRITTLEPAGLYSKTPEGMRGAERSFIEIKKENQDSVIFVHREECL